MPRRGTSGSLTSSFWIGSRPVAVFPSSEFSSFPRRESLKSCVFSDQVRWQANQQLRNKAVVEPSRSVVRISILFVCNYKPPPLCILLFPGAGREIECKVPAQKNLREKKSCFWKCLRSVSPLEVWVSLNHFITIVFHGFGSEESFLFLLFLSYCQLLRQNPLGGPVAGATFSSFRDGSGG